MSETTVDTETVDTDCEPATPQPATPRPVNGRRIRHQARDRLAVMALSATCSVGLALTFMLIASLAGHG